MISRVFSNDSNNKNFAKFFSLLKTRMDINLYSYEPMQMPEELENYANE